MEAWPVTPAGAVVVLGDSRADGIGSTPGTDRRWTDLLAGRLHARGGRTRCVINQGIGGNRLLSDGVGTAALARFDRDVLATPGLGHVVVAVGNDARAPGKPPDSSRCSPAGPVGVDDIIAAHLQVAARARAHGARVHAATIAPYGGSEMYSPEGDKAREQVNEWIRTSGAFDGVLDFGPSGATPPTPPVSAPACTWATISTAMTPATPPWRNPSTRPSSTEYLPVRRAWRGGTCRPG
ncbi:GDSL-type esterase/lipase family protein [Streptomyces sp. NPDC058369]|uniref:GDSL-type esterase/lipase family protein n=1 Tax=Streptomyces sp. NPDC058369 TaxID=3346462 RepID=UPI00364D86CC